MDENLVIRSSFEFAASPFLIVDQLQQIKKANKSFFKLSCYNKDEIIGVSIKSIFQEADFLSEFNIQNNVEYIAIERELIGKNTRIPVEITISKADTCYFLILRDLTKKKQEEKILRKLYNQFKMAKEKAEESNTLKTAFLQNMSHEIRTPMNGIIGFSEMLSFPHITEEQKTFYTEIIIKSSRHLLDIVNSILDLSKVEAGLSEIINKETDINRLLYDLKVFFKSTITKKDIKLKLNIKDINNEFNIIIDDVKLRQILSNLISNAIKFTHKGSVEFGYHEKEEYIEFFVKDTGIGVDEALYDKIFERFRQAELTTTREYGGTGLGLSICQAYVKLLGGKLWLESKIGKGTTFYFTIPNNKSINVNENITQDKTIKPAKLSKGNILIAEDEEYNYIYLKELIKVLKIDVLHAKNGREAIDLVKTNDNIKLVLMDIKMPVLNGIEATREIKKIRPGLVVIAQTAYAFPSDKQKIMKAGFDSYISKPINRTKLLNIIRKHY